MRYFYHAKDQSNPSDIEMRFGKSSIVRVAVSISPALVVLILTILISLATGHPEGLFLTRSIRGIVLRFALVTLIFVMPVLILPRLLVMVVKIAKNESFLGQFVVSRLDSYQELSMQSAWFIRPLQGIALSMIFAERLENLLEFLPARLVLFFMASLLVSLFLSIVWALDDLGIKIYNVRTGEVYMAGRSIGTVLPLIAAAIGISSLFHISSPIVALTELLQIALVLYPSYVFFIIFHREFINWRIARLSERLILKKIEVNLK